MRRVDRFALAAALLTAHSALAQSATGQHQATTPPIEARFEILQSSIVAKMTLRLDRYTGQVDQLVVQPDSSVAWQQVPRKTHPRDQDTRVAGRANYQVFTSGIAARYTFLINTTTGATWELVEDPASGWFWTPVL
jgi:hypothetical protein